MRTLAEPRDLLALAALCAGIFGPATAQAHFVLTSPPAAHEQNGLGDPQKAPPCGDNGASVPTGVVTPYQAGDTVTITIDETIYHPGHYRIALAINDPSELPAEPMVYESDDYDCGTADIMSPAVFPVLADGVWPHTDGFGKPQSIDVVLPDDISCTNCTLQVIQFMSDHGLNNPGGCFYHHCATISIEGGAAEGLTTAPTEDSGSGGDESSTGATSVTTAATNGDDTAEDTSDDAADASASASATAASTAPTTTAGSSDTDTAGSNDDDDGGCSCSNGGGHPLAAMLGLLGLLGLRTRRRVR